MFKRKVNCARCEGPITDRSDLKVANHFKSLKPFHKKCFKKYIEERQEAGHALLDTLPTNGLMATIMATIFMILVITFTFFIEVNLIAYLLCSIYPVYRLLTLLLFEIHIPKQN